MDMKDRIRQLMESQNMSQQDFAKILNMSPGSLSSIFNGRTRPTNNHTQAIHLAFPKVSVNWLLFGEGDMYTDGENQGVSPNPSLFATSDENGNIAKKNQMEVQSSSIFSVAAVPGGKYSEVLPESYSEKPKTEILHRNVKEIRVFFDDGTYETFLPSEQG